MGEDRRVRKTKKALQDSLLSLMDEAPIDHISVTELCNRADVNRSSFYKYYNDIEDIVEKMEDDILDAFSRQFKKPRLSLYDTVLRMTETVYEYRTIYGYIFRSKYKTRFLNKFFTAFQRQVIDAFNRQNTVLPKEQELKFAFVTRGNVGIIEHWINSDFKESVEYIAAVCERYTAAVVNEKR